MKKGTKVYSVLKHKCPRCQEGNLFAQKGESQYNIFGYTPQFCKICGQSFILEPGFYYGSMYISYAMMVALALPQFLVYYLAFKCPFLTSFFITGIVQLFLTPFVYKTSRAFWINLFVSFDKQYLSEEV